VCVRNIGAEKWERAGRAERYQSAGTGDQSCDKVADSSAVIDEIIKFLPGKIL
jgi:hypothetical protein